MLSEDQDFTHAAEIDMKLIAHHFAIHLPYCHIFDRGLESPVIFDRDALTDQTDTGIGCFFFV